MLLCYCISYIFLLIWNSRFKGEIHSEIFLEQKPDVLRSNIQLNIFESGDEQQFLYLYLQLKIKHMHRPGCVVIKTYTLTAIKRYQDSYIPLYERNIQPAAFSLLAGTYHLE